MMVHHGIHCTNEPGQRCHTNNTKRHSKASLLQCASCMGPLDACREFTTGEQTSGRATGSARLGPATVQAVLEADAMPLTELLSAEAVKSPGKTCTSLPRPRMRVKELPASLRNRRKTGSESPAERPSAGTRGHERPSRIRRAAQLPVAKRWTGDLSCCGSLTACHRPWPSLRRRPSGKSWPASWKEDHTSQF